MGGEHPECDGTMRCTKYKVAFCHLINLFPQENLEKERQPKPSVSSDVSPATTATLVGQRACTY